MTKVVGLDIGYSNVKISYGDRNVQKDPINLLFPAGVTSKDGYGESLIRSADRPVEVEVDGELHMAFVPQSHPSVSRVLHENYPRTVEYRALLAAALIKTGFTHINTLVTGLPSYQAMQSELKEELRAQLTGDHIINGTKITVDRVKVLAQPVGAFTNFAWHNPNLREMLTEAKTLVLDPGFFSLDWVLIHNGSLVKSSSSSSKKAMSFLLDRTREVFEKTYGRKVDVCRIEDAFRQSKTKSYPMTSTSRWLIR